jgi:hypothetical protein
MIGDAVPKAEEQTPVGIIPCTVNLALRHTPVWLLASALDAQ